jgi:predicted flap endonuclease-1-like 5' DNA nuclease
MTERFASDLVFILVVLLVAALLGFLIGYLIRRYKHLKRVELEDQIAQLKAKLDACQREKQTLLAERDSKQGMAFSAKADVKPELAFDAKAAAALFGSKVVLDDLKIVEGIGEKIDSILKSRGIDTWLKLSQTDPEKIKAILLEVGGPQYNIHEPKTWPRQALLAYEGKWTELKKWQDELNAGK